MARMTVNATEGFLTQMVEQACQGSDGSLCKTAKVVAKTLDKPDPTMAIGFTPLGLMTQPAALVTQPAAQATWKFPGFLRFFSEQTDAILESSKSVWEKAIAVLKGGGKDALKEAGELLTSRRGELEFSAACIRAGSEGTAQTAALKILEGEIISVDTALAKIGGAASSGNPTGEIQLVLQHLETNIPQQEIYFSAYVAPQYVKEAQKAVEAVATEVAK